MDLQKTENRIVWPTVVLRIFIGWHFLYEGVTKVYNPAWTSKGYLLSADGFMDGFYQWLASDSLVGVVDALNIGALLFVGATLILGIYERAGSLAGFALLMLYYFAHPAFPWLQQGPTEGNYWLINKNLVEAAALMVLYMLPTGRHFGLEILLVKKQIKTS